MKVRVVSFGSLKDVVGASVDLELPVGATAAALWTELCTRHPELQRWGGSVAIAVNQAFAQPTRVLVEGDEVALLPPVSGGAPQSKDAPPPDGAPQTKAEPQLPLQSAHARIQSEAIHAAKIVGPLTQGEDGAVCVFDGIVRNNTRGRKTLHLEYDCYLAMAIAEMEKLAEEALAKFAVRDVRLVHRMGRLDIGETSVFIAVASAHRAAAFDACRWLIDTLKKKVPIWKKEFFEDGAVWADGEPFPPEIGTV
jgi:molybdopterin synthase catalytic subunit/molybdopterin converting factor small subunit